MGISFRFSLFHRIGQRTLSLIYMRIFMKNIIRSWQEQVEKSGDSVALRDPKTGETRTYGELDDCAVRIAVKLLIKMISA